MASIFKNTIKVAVDLPRLLKPWVPGVAQMGSKGFPNTELGFCVDHRVDTTVSPSPVLKVHVCLQHAGIVLAFSAVSPVSGLYQISTQAQSLQCLVSHHDQHRRGQRGNDASRQTLGHPPGALLHQQLPKGLDNRWSTLHLQQIMFHDLCKYV